MAVKMYKLVSGEFIIAEAEADVLGQIVTMQSPMLVHFAPHENGQLAIQMFPLNPFAQSKHESIQISTSHLLFETIASDGLEKEYLRITSGLVTAPKNLKLVK
jgi:hypothetical protein